MRMLLIYCLFPFLCLSAQTDSLLRAVHWTEDGTDRRLLFTPDGTFQQDYGPAAGAGRYLLGRYAVDTDNQEVTLSVDYFLGKRRLPGKYRRGQDFYLVYELRVLTPERLVLRDVLTGEVRPFTAAPLDPADDPARRRVEPPVDVRLKLPPGWGG